MSKNIELIYHGTSFEGLCGIFYSDTIASFDCDGPLGASLTTSLDVACGFARGKSQERASDVGWNVEGGCPVEIFEPVEHLQWTLFGANGGGGGYIAFDKKSLSRLYEVVDFDELGDGSEFEVRVLGGNINNVLSSIDHVVVFDQNKFDQYCHDLAVASPHMLGAVERIKTLIRDPLTNFLDSEKVAQGKFFRP